MRRYLLTLSLVLASGANFAAPASSREGQTVSATAELASSFSAMPKGPTWTRPAPTTWSSRANVRWEARWGGDARYMV